MKRLFPLLLSFLTLTLSAQVRTYGDLETKTFVIGLSSYYFGDAGSLTLPSGAAVTLAGGRVSSGDQVLLTDAPAGDTLVGAHDFTGDGQPELVIATRGQRFVKAEVYQQARGRWTLLGTVGTRGDVDEIRVFRQAMTVRDRTAGTLHTWTFHDGRFDYKSSAGGSDPAAGI